MKDKYRNILAGVMNSVSDLLAVTSKLTDKREIDICQEPLGNFEAIFLNKIGEEPWDELVDEVNVLRKCLNYLDSYYREQSFHSTKVDAVNYGCLVALRDRMKERMDNIGRNNVIEGHSEEDLEMMELDARLLAIEEKLKAFEDDFLAP